MKSQHQLKPTGTWEVLRRIRIATTKHVDFFTVEDVISELAGVKK